MARVRATSSRREAVDAREVPRGPLQLLQPQVLAEDHAHVRGPDDQSPRVPGVSTAARVCSEWCNYCNLIMVQGVFGRLKKSFVYGSVLFWGVF